MKDQWEINPELKGKFVVINTESPTLESRIGFIDFRTITEEQANELIKAGTDYLKKK